MIAAACCAMARKLRVAPCAEQCASCALWWPTPEAVPVETPAVSEREPRREAA